MVIVSMGVEAKKKESDHEKPWLYTPVASMKHELS